MRETYRKQKDYERAELARNDLLAFTEYTFPGYKTNWHHEVIASYLTRWARGEILRLMVCVGPQRGKPVYNGSMILLQSGIRKRADQIEIGDIVITHKGRGRKVVAVFDQGLLPCVRIGTESGRSTAAAIDHPFMTPEGWVKAGNLRVGQTLACVPSPATLGGGSDIPLEKFRLIGYLIGDGCLSSIGRGTAFNTSITCFDPTQAEDVRHCIRASGFEVGKEGKGTIPLKGGARNWLRSISLDKTTSHTKRVPEFVFRGSQDQIAHYLGAYFACDGHVTNKGKGRRGNLRPDIRIEFASVNRNLLLDTQHLLLRLGMNFRIRTKRATFNTFCQGPHTSYVLVAQSQDEVARFARRVPVHGAKREMLDHWLATGARRKFDETFIAEEITSVEDAGLMPCRCFEVEEDHTFTSDDFVVHNSELGSRRLPAYLLGRNPDERVMACSYSASLASSMSRDVQRIMASEEYGRLFSGSPLAKRSSGYLRAADEFEIPARWGSYRSRGIGGGIAGRPFDKGIVDDPLKSRKEAESTTYRDGIWNWWNSDFYTRRSSDKAGILVINTRWNNDDLSGRLLKQATEDPSLPQWVVVSLPELAEPTPSIPEDRRPEGKELWTERYPLADVLQTKAAAGEYVFSALYQQRPVPREGGLFKLAGLSHPPLGFSPAAVRARVRYWDKGYSAKGDWTAGCRMSHTQEGMFVVEDVVRIRESPEARNRIILATAHADDKAFGKKVPVYIEQPIGAGAETTATLIRMLQAEGIVAHAHHPRGDKTERAEPFAAAVEANNVRLVKGTYISAFVAELTLFPAGEHDDAVDASSGAFDRITQRQGFKIAVV